MKAFISNVHVAFLSLHISDFLYIKSISHCY